MSTGGSHRLPTGASKVVPRLRGGFQIEDPCSGQRRHAPAVVHFLGLEAAHLLHALDLARSYGRFEG